MLEIVCPLSVKTLGKRFENGQLPDLLPVSKNIWIWMAGIRMLCLWMGSNTNYVTLEPGY